MCIGQAKSVEHLWHGAGTARSVARRVACAQARLDGFEHTHGTASGMRGGWLDWFGYMPAV